MFVAIFIGSIILLILLCGVVVSTKAISKRGRNDQSDAVYRDNYRYRNQYREEKDDFVSIESSSPEEQTTESAENNVEEESEDNLNGESTTVSKKENVQSEIFGRFLLA